MRSMPAATSMALRGVFVLVLLAVFAFATLAQAAPSTCGKFATFRAQAYFNANPFDGATHPLFVLLDGRTVDAYGTCLSASPDPLFAAGAAEFRVTCNRQFAGDLVAKTVPDDDQSGDADFVDVTKPDGTLVARFVDGTGCEVVPVN
jgi:hypothetical protein